MSRAATGGRPIIDPISWAFSWPYIAAAFLGGYLLGSIPFGLLVARLGGPPVRPYEVAVSFKPVKRDDGAGLYRRSVYTYWKRTGPAPTMMALDASKRDICVVKRERTSSPVQALVLLNDPQLVEASRVLAHQLVAWHGEDTGGIVVEAFRRLTSRRTRKKGSFNFN